MNVKYQLIYKCRLCGQEWTNSGTDSQDTAFYGLLSALTGVSYHQGLPINRYAIHHTDCPDGFGFSDLQGFKDNTPDAGDKEGTQ